MSDDYEKYLLQSSDIDWLNAPGSAMDRLNRPSYQNKSMQSYYRLPGLLGYLADIGDALVNDTNYMQKLGMLPIPVVSDVSGVLGDVEEYMDKPESRGLKNYALTAMGALPFIPSMAGSIKTVSNIDDSVVLNNAAKQGYHDDIWYHGTGTDFDTIDMAKLGKSTDTPAANKAFFMSDNKQVAQEFAGFAAKSGDPVVKSLRVRIPEGKAASINWTDIYGDVSLRSNNGQRLLAGLIEDMKSQGIDVIHIRNADDSISGKYKGNILAVTDPGLLRSTDAKFNPRDIGKNGLLLGGAGVMALPMLASETGDSSD